MIFDTHTLSLSSTLYSVLDYSSVSIPRTLQMATIAKAALQSAVINAGSNVLAQGIKAYRAEVRRKRTP